MKTFMPGMVASCGRSVLMMSPTSSCRSALGLRVTTICPRFRPPSVLAALPPMVETSATTLGFWRIRSATCPWYSTSLS